MIKEVCLALEMIDLLGFADFLIALRLSSSENARLDCGLLLFRYLRVFHFNFNF